MASNSESLENRILHLVSKKDSKIPEFSDDLVESTADCDEEIEEIEEITEDELLQYLDKEEHPLSIAQRLFYNEVNSTLSQSHEGDWNLRHLSAKTIEDLYGHGWTYVDNLIDLEILKYARIEAEEMLESGALCSANLTKTDDPFRDNDARDDVIRWLNYEDKEHLPPNFQHILDFFHNQLHQDLAKMIRLRGRNEYQLSYYHTNDARYERHRDALPTDDPEDTEQRRITAILYLNPSWTPGDGGELKIYGQQSHGDMAATADRHIHPLLGRVVLFLSGVVDHAVLAAKKERFAVTAWMR